MPGAKEIFEMDKKLESKGVRFEYPTFAATISRSSGTNSAYSKRLAAKSKPFRRAIDMGVMKEEDQLELVKDVFAEKCVLNWETLIAGEWKEGIWPEDAGEKVTEKDETKVQLLPCTYENVLKVFNELPDVFTSLLQDSRDLANYRKDDGAAKN